MKPEMVLLFVAVTAIRSCLGEALFRQRKYFLSQNCLVQGLVDPQQELLKLTLRQQKLERQLLDISARMQAAGYSEKVSQIVQDEHQQKVSALQTDLQRLGQATLNFQRMLSDDEKAGV